MQKIPNLFKSKTFPITQSPHGVNQGMTAFDLNCNEPLLAPFDCFIPEAEIHNLGGMSFYNVYFLPKDSKAMLQVVHALPPRSGEFKAGEIIGNPQAYLNTKKQRVDHFHISLKVNGRWEYLPCFLDPEQNKLTNAGGLIHAYWFDYQYWYRTYGNKSINITFEKPPIMTTPDYSEALAWHEEVAKKYKIRLLVNTDTEEQKQLVQKLYELMKFLQEKFKNNPDVKRAIVEFYRYVGESKAV